MDNSTTLGLSITIFISPTASKTCNDKEMNNGLMAGNQYGKIPSCWPPIAQAE